MSDVQVFVDQLAERGIIIRCHEGRLLVEAPPGALTDEHKARIRALKPELLELLANQKTAVMANQTPEEHFWSLAEGHEEQGIFGRLGVAAGPLMLAMQGWQAAHRKGSPGAAEWERRYWQLWQDIDQGRSA